MRMQLLQDSTFHAGLRLDPRTKLYIMLSINIVMVGGGGAGGIGVYIGPVLAAVPFLLLLAGRKRKAALIYAVFYIAAWLAVTFLIESTGGILNLLIMLFSGLGLRWIPCIVMGYYVLSTTRVSEFVASMERMHITQKIVIPVSVMFRFFPTVFEEAHAINDAMRMRSIGIKSLYGNPVSLLEYRMVPLLISIAKIGNELSAAALTRGLGGSVKRTNICRIGFGIFDIVIAAVVTAAVGIYIVF